MATNYQSFESIRSSSNFIKKINSKKNYLKIILFRMMSKKSKLYKLDFLGLPVMLSYYNDYKYRTSLGLFISFSFVVYLIVYAVMNIKPLFSNSGEFTYISRSEKTMYFLLINN